MNIEDIRGRLEYNQDTGSIRWRVDLKNMSSLKEAGSISKSKGGSRFIAIGGVRIQSRVIAWVLHYGVLPEGRLFHINGDIMDNRICNLDYVINRPKKKHTKIHEHSVETIGKNFKYNPESGEILRLSCGEYVKCGSEYKNGRLRYVFIGFMGDSVSAHRLAWLLHHGSWPVGVIDHIDQNGLNNRIANLRDVSQYDNLRNSRRSISNKTGVTGVSFSPTKGKYIAKIVHRYKAFSLGTFETLEEAAEARRKAEKELGFHENHGK